MIVRVFDKQTDYSIIHGWWKLQGFVPLHPDLLPTGFIVDGVAAAFAYCYPGVSLGMMEWIVTNPEAPSADRDKAMDMVLEACATELKAAGAKIALAYLMDERLIERYKKHGFAVTGTGVTEVMRRL